MGSVYQAGNAHRMADRTENESAKSEQNRDGEKNAHQSRRLESSAGRERYQPHADQRLAGVVCQLSRLAMQS